MFKYLPSHRQPADRERSGHRNKFFARLTTLPLCGHYTASIFVSKLAAPTSAACHCLIRSISYPKSRLEEPSGRSPLNSYRLSWKTPIYGLYAACSYSRTYKPADSGLLANYTPILRSERYLSGNIPGRRWRCDRQSIRLLWRAWLDLSWQGNERTSKEVQPAMGILVNFCHLGVE